MARLLALLFLLAALPLYADDEHDDRRAAECRETLKDQRYLVNLIMQGDNFPHLRERAANSRERLGEDRYAEIIDLIDKAEKAEDLQAWFDEYWHACYDGV